jgi:flagella basal body P-ring formation protein FlgA
MSNYQRQPAIKDTVGHYAALGVSALVLALSVVLAVLCFAKAHAAEAEQLVAPETLLQLVQDDAVSVLGVSVALEPLRALPPVLLPAGEIALCVRYPKRAGLSLPEAVECRSGGRLVTSIPLGQYTRFRLQVLLAPDGLPARALIDTARLVTQEQVLCAGTEVTTLAQQVAGLSTRGMLPAGARVVQSRLMRPYDVARGAMVLLVIAVDGVRMETRAVALADGYLGQRLAVQREDDKRKYIGLVCAGPQVVVE